jgi:GT2 family glycosyltransferase
MRHREFGAKRQAVRMPPVGEVTAASGCALLVRRAVFDRCGLLDEPYFFSFEDVEFCLRARASGFSTICVSAATVLHKGSGTMGARSPQRIYYGVRNHLRLAQQVAPRSALPRLARAAAIVAYNTAYVMRTPDVRLLAGAAALTRGSFDYVRGRYGR